MQKAISFIRSPSYLYFVMLQIVINLHHNNLMVVLWYFVVNRSHHWETFVILWLRCNSVSIFFMLRMFIVVWTCLSGECSLQTDWAGCCSIRAPVHFDNNSASCRSTGRNCSVIYKPCTFLPTSASTIFCWCAEQCLGAFALGAFTYYCDSCVFMLDNKSVI